MITDPPVPSDRRPIWRRLLPLGLLAALAVAVYGVGLTDQLSLETLVAHRAAIDSFVSAHGLSALLLYGLVYVVAAALSLPGALLLTVTGGFLFGALAGGGAAAIGATLGATLLFLIARSAFGELLLRRAGPKAEQLAAGFRADAFNYLLFLRLVPAFPFFLVNLAAALFAVRLSTFVAATAIGILPGCFAFSFLGAGLDSLIAAPAEQYQACLAAGRRDCRLDFDLTSLLAPELLIGLLALGLIALAPVLVRKWRGQDAGKARKAS